MEILEKAQRMLERYPLCSHCLGRQFALLGHGLSNKERGEAIKTLLTMKGHQLALAGMEAGINLLKALAVNGASKMAARILQRLGVEAGAARECYLCGGAFKAIDDLVRMALERLEGYEFANFLVGVRLPREVEEREDEFKAEFGVEHGESMRNEFSREIGKRISQITQKPVEYRKPDIIVLVNPFTRQVLLQVNPLYIAGRYRKLVRGIPQARWICVRCGGRGCPRCNWTGKMYPDSVEELIGEPTLEMTLGEDIAFHASGREDVDARMLGTGRPFVIEVKRPKRRFINLQELTNAINEHAQGKVEVLNLQFADRDVVRKIKQAEGSEKVYRVIVEFERPISDEELKTLENALSNTTIRQQTPLRVLHRRADRIREKHIYEAKIKRLTHNRIEMTLRCQGGLYIKELITGDEGRTRPSVFEILGVKPTHIELDVLDVIMRGYLS